ncbi:hypothetical protein [Vibrio phage VEN]|uniref:Rhamnogalacturonase A/B/Epimerase-like pectate lyase domain-containing protein n=1 Tax=Vibrio phage VEN TaxID=2059879 RepID=A0A2H5BMZ1_9CAUD|nr:hypothetical protein HOS56_gp49 [Vibrio phage VEN]AUG87655.1 hypothetical protein [Vibrio phage VEN]
MIITDDIKEVLLALTSLTKPRARWATFKLNTAMAVLRSLFDKLLDNSVSLKDFGAKGDGVTDDTSAIKNALDFVRGKRIFLHIPEGKYIFSETLNLYQVWLSSNSGVLLKNFNGVGLDISGGSYFFRFRGDLEVNGHGVGKGDGTEAATLGANGIEFNGCRLDIIGKLQSFYHKGDAIVVNAVGNMNRSFIRTLHGYYSNGVGLRCKGTQDDCAVWTMSTYTYGNYEGGVHVSDDFQGRAWTWNCYNEGSVKSDAVGVYLGQLRFSEKIDIYSEEQASTGFELLIGANCSNLKIHDARLNRTKNLSPETCIVVGGNGGLWTQESISYQSPIRSTALTDNVARYIGKKVFGSSNDLVAEERIYGNGSIETTLHARANAVDIVKSSGESLGDAFHQYGLGYPRYTSFSYNGTKESPLPSLVGTVFQQRSYAYLGGSVRQVSGMSVDVNTIVGNSTSTSITFSLTMGGLSPQNVFRLNEDGTVELLVQGAGIISTASDGLRYKLSPPPGGGNATWVAV